MPVVNQRSKPTEAIDHKYLFVDRIHIDQTKNPRANMPPLYSIKILYRFVGFNTHGEAVYTHPEPELTLPNYLAEAMVKMAAGDDDLMVAFKGIEKAVVDIINDKTGSDLVVN